MLPLFSSSARCDRVLTSAFFSLACRNFRYSFSSLPLAKKKRNREREKGTKSTIVIIHLNGIIIYKWVFSMQRFISHYISRLRLRSANTFVENLFIRSIVFHLLRINATAKTLTSICIKIIAKIVCHFDNT